LTAILYSKLITGDVAARPRQAVDEAGADWIADHRSHDRHRPSYLQQRPYGRCPMDDVRRERSQLRCVFANSSGIARRPTGLDSHVLAGAPAQLLQSLQKRSEPRLKFRIVRSCGQEYSYAPHPLALLRLRSKRPHCHRASKCFDELAPSHCLLRGSGQGTENLD